MSFLQYQNYLRCYPRSVANREQSQSARSQKLMRTRPWFFDGSDAVRACQDHVLAFPTEEVVVWRLPTGTISLVISQAYYLHLHRPVQTCKSRSLEMGQHYINI